MLHSSWHMLEQINLIPTCLIGLVLLKSSISSCLYSARHTPTLSPRNPACKVPESTIQPFFVSLDNVFIIVVRIL